MNKVLFDFNALPKPKLLVYREISIPLPSLANSLNCSSAETFPPPKVSFKNPSGVYSVINFCEVDMYLPTFTPG